MNRTKVLLKNIIVCAFWLGLWWLLSFVVDKQLLLPSPPDVLDRLSELLISAAFWKITLTSLGRILVGAIISLVLGSALAVLCCRSPLLRDLFSPLLTVIKSTPVASFIILVLIWVGRDFVPAFIVVLMALPIVWANVSEGITSTDPSLLEMARLFRFPPLRLLRRVYIPSVLPHFVSACRSCLGLAWKAGVAAEILTVPAVSIGKMIYESKLYLETVDLFAWTLVVIILSLIIEKVLMAAVGRLARGSFAGGEGK